MAKDCLDIPKGYFDELLISTLHERFSMTREKMTRETPKQEWSTIPAVNVIVKTGYLTIYLEEILHLSLYLDETFAIQSWVKDSSWYCIDYHTNNGVVYSKYDNKDTWQEILKQIDKKL